MASAKQVVGNPTPRIEGELKVSGQAKYAVDVTLPGMLWGRSEERRVGKECRL